MPLTMMTKKEKIENYEDIKSKIAVVQLYLADILEIYGEFLEKNTTKFVSMHVEDMLSLARKATKRIDDKIEILKAKSTTIT